MREYGFSLTRILPYKDRIVDSVSENPYSRIFYAVDHLFSTHVKFSDKLTILTPGYAHVRVRIRGVRNVSFSEIFCVRTK